MDQLEFRVKLEKITPPSSPLPPPLATIQSASSSSCHHAKFFSDKSPVVDETVSREYLHYQNSMSNATVVGDGGSRTGNSSAPRFDDPRYPLSEDTDSADDIPLSNIVEHTVGYTNRMVYRDGISTSTLHSLTAHNGNNIITYNQDAGIMCHGDMVLGDVTLDDSASHFPGDKGVNSLEKVADANAANGIASTSRDHGRDEASGEGGPYLPRDSDDSDVPPPKLKRKRLMKNTYQRKFSEAPSEANNFCLNRKSFHDYASESELELKYFL